MGILPLTYARPSYVSEADLRHSQASGKCGTSSCIPEPLSFDKIISGETCPPLTLRDFMNYLLYMEHSAENLQFYLWHQSYVKRFDQAPKTDLLLSPEWTSTMEAEVVVKLQKEATANVKSRAPNASEEFNDAAFEKIRRDTLPANNNPFSTPPRTPVSNSDRDSNYASSTQSSNAFTFRSQASDAFAAAGAPVPFTIQPFREEIDRILSTYILDGAPRELNLSDRARKSVIYALSYTTHPSALRTAFESVDTSLRHQNHPNFIRWSIGNGNPARISCARTLGFAGIFGAFLVAVILTLSSLSRGWRAFAIIGWTIGICTVVASYRGMCICMYSLNHHRHIRPWELFMDDEEPMEMDKRSFDSFGSGNSFEQEPWVVKYEEQSTVRKIFDREAWIQEPALRGIQDTIFVQALIVGVLSAGTFAAIFIPLPRGNFF